MFVPMDVADLEQEARLRRDSLARLEAAEQRFAARQRVSRRWVPLIWVVGLFDERIGPEGCGYDHLTKAVRAGIFNRDGRSQLLLFDRVVSGPDGSYSAVPRRLDLDEVEALLAATPDGLSPVTVLCNQRLRYCWAPADLVARWLEDHGLPRPLEWFGDLSGNTQTPGASRSGATIGNQSRRAGRPGVADIHEPDESRPRPNNPSVRAWFRERVVNWPGDKVAPSEEDDWIAINQHFAPGLSRAEFRLVRTEETPPMWRKQGKRRPWGSEIR